MATAFNSFYWMDDFWKRYELIHTGFFRFQWDIYWGWDGRGISPIYTLRNLFLLVFDYPESWAVTLISMGFLLGSAYYMSLILLRDEWTNISGVRKATCILLITFILIMVFRPHLSRSFYWATGSFYTLANFFCVFAIYRLLRKTNSKWNYWWFFVGVSTGSNSGCLLICFLVLAQLMGLIQLKSTQFWILFSLGLITLGLVTFAPGNFQRANGSLEFTFATMLDGGLAILKEYAGMSSWVGFGAVVLALYLFNDIPKIGYRMLIAMVLSAGASILPFLPMASAASKHTAIHFQTFLLLAAVLNFVLAIRFLSVKIPATITNSLTVFFLLFFAFQISTQYKTGRELFLQMQVRMDVLERNRGSKTVIKLKSLPIPDQNWTSRFWDVTNDPNYYANKYVQKYFEIAEVYIEE